jgi:hypothetical protein
MNPPVNEILYLPCCKIQLIMILNLPSILKEKSNQIATLYILHLMCVWQVSIRAILAGEQITVDYGHGYWHARGIDPSSF